MNKATPGPWTWNDSDQLTAGSVLIVETDSGVYPPHGADRLLIAAAPELLAALQIAQRRMVNASECDIAFIDAAIAKATGN